MSCFSFTSRFLNFALLIFIFMAPMAFCFQYEVGGEKGWVVPTGNETETYNRWAARQRFNIGDTLYFKYQNDSVLEVRDVDYKACNTSNPLAKYEKGYTVFQFDRSGSFYFISGEEDHCKSGQKLIVQVIHSSGEERGSSAAPASSPEPEESSGGSGRDSGDSTGSLGATSGGSIIKSNVALVVISGFGVMFGFLFMVV
ncbi:hypothetical protein LIER_01675 [Lithospermum erythrorhizon]|uniref:Phytocyanin domain-containing protein n=1 Tax=Lithospermum erythrorhizon TaxID=34254 RepID=A0AAV3NP67_LITER